MDIQKEEFDFINSAEPNCVTIASGKDLDYVEGRRSLKDTELQTLDLYEGSDCVTVTKLDVQKMIEYFNTI